MLKFARKTACKGLLKGWIRAAADSLPFPLEVDMITIAVKRKFIDEAMSKMWK
jgi:hypothetical protein